MFPLLLGILPNFLLNGVKAWLDAKHGALVETETTKRSIFHDAVSGTIALRQAQAGVIQTGMSHKAFWVPWLMAAIPATVWYAWGMADSSFPGYLPHVAALPSQLKEYTDAIWSNLFLSGGIALGTSAIAGAIAKRL